MADSGFPNRNRADNALTIYRDAMRGYIAPALERKHGRDWFRSQVLTDDAREHNRNSYERRRQSLDRNEPAQNLIDLRDIPFLVQKNLDAFPDLDQFDTRRMHQIQQLRNEIYHPHRSGDCAPEEAASIAGLCTLVVKRCGLSDAAENIRHLSAGEPASAPVDAESVSRKERERQEWDKERLASKPAHELTPWEQQRLAEIEWEEEWERRELVRSEREEIEQLGGDIDGLRRWFDADPERQERHTSEYAALIRRERERERAEIAAFGDDIDGLRRWFDADPERQKHHASTYAALIRQERERTEIAAFGDDIDRLRHWFDTDPERQKRHPSTYAALIRRELERERLEREAAEIAAFGDDIDGLRSWFDAVGERKNRHPSAYASLIRREREQQLKEREQAKIATFGDDLNDLRQWFDVYKTRPKRHPSEYATLLQREQERKQEQERREKELQEHERERRERQERERAEIAAFGDDIDGLRQWFDRYQVRPKRHPSEYAKLTRRELLERERAEIAAFGDDIDGLRQWFDADQVRPRLHRSEYAALLQRERERLLQREQERRKGRERHERETQLRERERAEIAAFGDDLDGLRQWFRVDKRRPKRHAAEHAALLRRERQEREQQGRSQRPTQGARRSILSRVFRR